MAFGELEKKIIDIIYHGKGTIEDICDVFKQGADPNAKEREPSIYDYIDREPYYETLFSEMIFSNNYGKGNFKTKDLLQSIMDAGLDINKYGSSIIGSLKYTDYDEEDEFYEMCKMILESCEVKISLNVAKDMIGTEESYLTCCHPLDDISLELKLASYLYGVYELLEAYEKGEEYTNYHSFKKAIGQKVKSIRVNGNTCMTNQKDFRVKPFMDFSDFKTVIELENDQLIVEYTASAYVYNGEVETEFNSFSYDISSVLEDSSLEEFRFAPLVKKKSSEAAFPVYDLELIFSGGHSLLYYRNEDGTEGVRLVATEEAF